MTGTTDGRRTDTRQRIHQVALDVFSERGYEKATLREIAERLEVTRPALYYHYKSKEDILASIHRDLASSIDDIIDWACSRPADLRTRREVLHRLSALMAGPWGQFTRFAQENEAAMRDLAAASEFVERMESLAELLRPSDTVRGRMRARLALSALFMAGSRAEQLGGTDQVRSAAALETADELVADG
ncbi:TetR/AcrR family transcriptional regulator [Streptomyces rhizosphaericus]|uniref:TetR/AcrR family transcriptional regulator n=1 Tax=Streptomyces rhizosphaericus TaxID=114699 RepID=A0A6G4A7J8_9ACTN|nr:TetR family transcriptional regulator [Streptomyces rhizosphaericus]NEW69242.1 TetR/AcrR family transcriptional regulator [Streptomyces rhizosphaericus]